MKQLVERGLNVYQFREVDSVEIMNDFGLLSCLYQIQKFVEFEPNRLRFLQFCEHPEKTLLLTNLDDFVEAKKMGVGFVLGLFKTTTSTKWYPHTKNYFDLEKLKEAGFEIDWLATKILRHHAHIAEHQHNLFFTKRTDAPLAIPTKLLVQWGGLSVYMRCRALILMLRRLIMLIPYHFKLQSIDQKRLKWKEEEVAKLKERYDFSYAGWREGNRGVLATVSSGEVLYSFFDTSVVRSPKDIPFDFIDHWFELGDRVSQEVAIAKSLLQSNSIRLNEPNSLKRGNGLGLVVSTLVFNDFMFIEPWIEHYRKYGAKHFLIYFNYHEIPVFLEEIARNEEDVTLIPWGVVYSKSCNFRGKSSWHVAQPMQLHHSEILARAWDLGSHLLNVDIDEYIVGRFSLDDFVKKECVEVGFHPVWACSENFNNLPHEASLTVNPDCENLVSSKKILRSLSLFAYRNIHGDRTEQRISPDHVMLHFGGMLTKRSELRQFLGRQGDASTSMRPMSELEKNNFVSNVLSNSLH